MVMWRDKNSARELHWKLQEMTRKCSRVGIVNASNMRAERRGDRLTSIRSNLVRAAVFRILNDQLENGGSKNVLDMMMRVFKVYGCVWGTCGGRKRDFPSGKRLLSALNGPLSGGAFH